jgi:hypothetical protein
MRGGRTDPDPEDVEYRKHVAGMRSMRPEIKRLQVKPVARQTVGKNQSQTLVFRRWKPIY